MTDALTDKVLGKRVRVLMCDDRLIEGHLSCLDNKMNLIIEGALEFYNVPHDQGKGKNRTC